MRYGPKIGDSQPTFLPWGKFMAMVLPIEEEPAIFVQDPHVCCLLCVLDEVPTRSSMAIKVGAPTFGDHASYPNSTVRMGRVSEHAQMVPVHFGNLKSRVAVFWSPPLAAKTSIACQVCWWNSGRLAKLPFLWRYISLTDDFPTWYANIALIGSCKPNQSRNSNWGV
jgi:hypothetical protein